VRGSLTLAAIGAGLADLLFAGGPTFLPTIFEEGSQYGLLSSDSMR